MTTAEEGRELMIQFTCTRCKREAIERFVDVMKGEHYDYLRNSKLPEGWETIGYGRIVCETCADAYEKFMKMEWEG